MCFRPPSAEAGESVCPGCYTITKPDSQGKCPDCGAVMVTEESASPGMAAPQGVSAAPQPGAPKAPAPPAPPKD